MRLDHHVFTKGEWKQARLREHPRVPITVSIDNSAQTRYGNPTRTLNTHAEVSAITDTGAQSDLWSMKDFLACGFSHDDLLPVRLSLSAANRSPISIEGAFFAKITTRLHNREATSCRSMIYVSNSVQAMYLSYVSLLNLGILSNYFPSPQTVDTPTGRCHASDPESVNTTCELPPINTVRAINNGCHTSGDHRDHRDLVVVTDHKPLVKIFGERTLDEITNSRLFRLKQRTLPWRFDINHLPGKTNHAADATSRHPSPSGSANSITLGVSSIPDQVESALMASIRQDTQELGTITWSLLAQATASDTSLSTLLKLIEQGAPSLARNNPSLATLWPICESVYAQEGVLLYQDRVIVPTSLRSRVLQNLHAAHQGTSMMEQRARAIVYWPGMSKDIRDTRDRCVACNRNAPAQAAPPPLPTTPPSTPFEAVFADFFTYGGRHYLVVGDRLSGWVEVLGSPAGTTLAGAAGLICHLRSFFATFGVPEELSSDGGPEFTAGCTEAFLRLWGVRHRVSSTHFPQSNGRAEVAVKTAKRLLMSHTGPTGSLNHDHFLHATLQLRNTPDPDCNISPAQIVFGRPLRDTLSFVNRLEKFSILMYAPSGARHGLPRNKLSVQGSLAPLSP